MPPDFNSLAAIEQRPGGRTNPIANASHGSYEGHAAKRRKRNQKGVNQWMQWIVAARCGAFCV
jgi:hypothetical protein